MTKYVGWPEPSEVKGHMIKRLGAPGTKHGDEYECQDCHVVGDYHSFDVSSLYGGGCPRRPESLSYLKVGDRFPKPTLPGHKHTEEQAEAAREHWLSFAERVGKSTSAGPITLDIEERHWFPVEDRFSNVIAAFYTCDRWYELLLDGKTEKITVERVIGEKLEWAEPRVFPFRQAGDGGVGAETCAVCRKQVPRNEFNAVRLELPFSPRGASDRVTTDRQIRHVGDCTDWRATIVAGVESGDELRSHRFQDDPWKSAYPVTVDQVDWFDRNELGWVAIWGANPDHFDGKPQKQYHSVYESVHLKRKPADVEQ